MENVSLNKQELNIKATKLTSPCNEDESPFSVMDDRVSPFTQTLEELRENIRISIGQAERGEVIGEEDVLKLLRRYQ